MMEQQEIKIGSEVEILRNQRRGVVDAIFTDRGGTQYRVEWVKPDSEIRSDYFRAQDLRVFP